MPKKIDKPEPVEFDINRFRQASFERRTFDFDVSGSNLADFFPKGVKPIFVLQSVEGKELAEIRKSTTNRIMERKLAEEHGNNEKVKTVLAALNIDASVGDHLNHQIEMLRFGIKEPKLSNYTDAAKIMQFSPNMGEKMVDKIAELSGIGAAIKKK